jgi:Abortive infection C-terminus
LLGTAKEMLESTAKYVLDLFSIPYSSSTDFDQLWFHARDRLGLHPKDVDVSQSGGEQVREMLQSSWSIARLTNELRNIEGTGHGRTLPTAMTAEMALLVVREACSVAQMVLASLDRHLGR